MPKTPLGEGRTTGWLRCSPNTPETKYEHPYGDVEPYGLESWLRELKSPNLIETGALDLEYVATNPWTALDRMGIRGNWLRGAARYKCPDTERWYSAVLPVLFVPKTEDDTQRFVEAVGSQAYMRDMAVDRVWNAKKNERLKAMRPDEAGEIPAKRLSPVDWCLLGPGYTEAILPCDGAWSLMLNEIAVEGGAALLCLHFVWHNK